MKTMTVKVIKTIKSHIYALLFIIGYKKVWVDTYLKKKNPVMFYILNWIQYQSGDDTQLLMACFLL